MKPAIIVTGAASGMGREFARLAAAEETSVVLVDRAREALEAVTAELRSRRPGILPLALDLASGDAALAIERAMSASGLYCDTLVNNAGLSLVGPAVTNDVARQLALFDVNVAALTELSHHFLPGMIDRRGGGVLNVGSIGGYIAGPNMAVYNATKAYVGSFSSHLARAAGGSGVTVACLVLGSVRTAMWQKPPQGPKALLERLPTSDAAEVARAAWTQFRHGKELIVPQLFYRLASHVLGFIPPRYYLQLTKGWFGSQAMDEVAVGHLKPAVVMTGACSPPGLQLAMRASRDAGAVVLVGGSGDGHRLVADYLTARGKEVHLLAVDLVNAGAGEVIDRALAERGLYCDVLINAPDNRAKQTGMERSMAAHKGLLANARVSTELTLRFLAGMAARRRGGVVNLSELGPGTPEGDSAACQASRAYFASLSQALACEVKSLGVTVSLLTSLSDADRAVDKAWRDFRRGKPIIAV